MLAIYTIPTYIIFRNTEVGKLLLIFFSELKIRIQIDKAATLIYVSEIISRTSDNNATLVTQ